MKLREGMKIECLRNIDISVTGGFCNHLPVRAFTIGKVYAIRKLIEQHSDDKRWFVTDDRNEPEDPHELGEEFVKKNFQIIK